MFCCLDNSKFLTKKRVIGVNINLNVTIIANFTITVGGFIWRYITTYGNDFWYSNTQNPDIAVPYGIKPFWIYLSSNWGITVICNCINYYLHPLTWDFYPDNNTIIIGLGSLSCCDSWPCDIVIHVWSVEIYILISAFPSLAILCFLLKFQAVIYHF